MIYLYKVGSRRPDWSRHVFSGDGRMVLITVQALFVLELRSPYDLSRPRPPNRLVEGTCPLDRCRDGMGERARSLELKYLQYGGRASVWIGRVS